MHCLIPKDKSTHLLYQRQFKNLKKNKIAFAVALATPEMLIKIKENMTRRLNKTIEVEGRHFENMNL